MSQRNSEPSAEQLQDLLLESPGFAEFLLSLTTLTAAALGGRQPMLCAITVERVGNAFTVASSTPAARALDDLQYRLHRGPCLTALRTNTTVLVADTRAETRWSGYSNLMDNNGIASVLAMPIPAGNGAAAALNCYARDTGVFTPATVARIQEHAASISGILRLALRVHFAEPFPADQRKVLQSRSVIDAAVALVMLQHRCSKDKALKVLSSAAQQPEETMHTIARDILARAADQSGRPPDDRPAD